MNMEEKIVVRVDSEIADIVPAFLENRNKDVKTILGALVNEDYETIRILGHSMKGSGSGYGFDAISSLGRSLEQEAMNMDAGRIRRLAEEISAYLGRVEVIYE